MRNIFGSDVNNQVDVRNVYGNARGGTVGTRAGAFTPYTAGAPGSEVPVGGNGGGAIIGNGVFGKPLSWWFLLVVLLFGLMFTAQRFGTVGEDFKSIRMSVYNIVVITLAAMIGFGAFKVIFGRIRVPGLSDYVQAV
jgi:hypothetical protein